MNDPKTIVQEIRALRETGCNDLRSLYTRLTGRRTKTRNGAWLRKHIGGLLGERAPDDARVKRALRDVDKPPPTRAPVEHDSRIPPVGSVIRREYKGRELAVTVTKAGFEYLGRPYRSLSAIAREVTGARWSGPLFFGLAPRSRGGATG